MKKFLKIFLFLLLGVNLYMLAAGKMYWYKALVYNYVNIDDLDLFATRKVEAGNFQPWAIGSDYNKIPLTQPLKDTLEKYRSVSFLVIKDDSIRTENYWDGYGQTSLSNSFSVAKSIISILVGIALDEGKIKSLDQKVCEFIPEFCSDENKSLTIQQLLSMSSGLNFDEGYTSLFGKVTEMYYGGNLHDQMTKLKVVDTPGKDFNYMSCNTELLAMIVSKATGKNISEYASEKLWKPIGAEHDAQWSLDGESGIEKAYCCFYSNARDFARIGKLFLHKGNWNGMQIVSESYMTQAVKAADLNDHGTPNKIYGYQWWLTESQGEPVFYARGILGQYIFVIPGRNIVVVRLGHQRPEKNADGNLPDIPVYLEEVMKMYPIQNISVTNPV